MQASPLLNQEIEVSGGHAYNIIPFSSSGM